MSTEKVVVGVLAGIAVGVLFGVLFAPDKGSETRKKISIAFKRRCITENTEISEKAFLLRKEIANIFGFKNIMSSSIIKI